MRPTAGEPSCTSRARCAHPSVSRRGRGRLNWRWVGRTEVGRCSAPKGFPLGMRLGAGGGRADQCRSGPLGPPSALWRCVRTGFVRRVNLGGRRSLWPPTVANAGVSRNGGQHNPGWSSDAFGVGVVRGVCLISKGGSALVPRGGHRRSLTTRETSLTRCVEDGFLPKPNPECGQLVSSTFHWSGKIQSFDAMPEREGRLPAEIGCGGLMCDAVLLPQEKQTIPCEVAGGGARNLLATASKN